METCQVVIAGSGPTGLLLAAELALAGVDVVVLERNPGRTGHTRALHMQPRTAEVLDLRGVLDGVKQRAIAHLADGYYGGVPVPLSYDGWSARYPSLLRIPQPRVEEQLEEHLEKLGVRVRYQGKLTGLVQDSDGVTVTVSGPDGEYEIRAGFLVGCDGGGSAVRKLAGIEFPGTDARAFGVAGDVVLSRVPEEVSARNHSAVGVFGRAQQTPRFVVLMALDEPGRYRAGYVDGNIARRPEDPDEPVTKEEMAGALHERFGDEIEVAELVWGSRFTDACRQVATYRAGRVFVAGDAAHIHLPASSQGMGLGIQDAMNLGWKLAAYIKGFAGEELLDTYHTERHVATKRVLESTKAQGLMTLNSNHPGVDGMRTMLIELMSLPEVNRLVAGMLSGLDIRYPVGGSTESGAHELLGTRMPDIELPATGQQTRWMSSLLHRGHGLLLTTDPAFVRTAAPWSDRVDIVELTTLPLPGEPAEALLVRPDGYVCWTAPGPDLVAALTTWFGAPAQ
ncbi:FAD-dependent monooxygenase [Nocardia sp. NPDC004123]